MHTKAVFRSAKALLRIGCAVLRFNFRSVGASEGSFDEGRGEQDDFRAALDFMAARHPGVDLWAAWFSFGAWIALTVGATDDRVTTLVALGLPVACHDIEPVVASTKPVFLIHGSRDELIPLRAVQSFYSRLSEPKRLVVIDAASHLFKGKLREVGEAVESLLGDHDGRHQP